MNVVWVIWHYRNNLRFDNKVTTFLVAIKLVISNVSLNDKCRGDVRLYVRTPILRAFDIAGKPSRAPSIKQVNWFPPLCHWIKCNTDEPAKGNPRPVGCGEIFCDHSAATLGCFASSLGIIDAFFARLFDAMMAIELAHKKRLEKCMA